MKNLLKTIILIGVILFPVMARAADTKISAMTAKDTPVAADVTVIVDSNGGANKKITLGTIPAGLVTNANDAGNYDVFPLWSKTQGGAYAVYSTTGLTYHPSTGVLTAAGFAGPLVGNVTGDVSGSSGTCTGNALSATTAANLSGTPTVPDGTAATTQSQGNNSTRLATTAYVDTGLATKAAVVSPAPANGAYSGVAITGTAGENVAIGDVCYLKTDGKYWKAKGDAAGTMPAVALATGTISADATGAFLLSGYIRIDAGFGGDLTLGSPTGRLWVSAATAGVLTQTQPATSTNIAQDVGYAIGVRTIFFDPQRTLVTVP